MATTSPFHTDSNPLPTPASLSSISKPSKGLLSFTKHRKSSSSKVKLNPPLPALDEIIPQQPARPTQGNGKHNSIRLKPELKIDLEIDSIVRRAVIRDSIAIRDTPHSGQRTIIRKRASIRLTAASGQSGAPTPGQISPLSLRHKESDLPVASGASMPNSGRYVLLDFGELQL